MIRYDVFACEDAFGRPGGVGVGPEGMAFGQTQGEKGGGAKIETACVDVVFGKAGLLTVKAVDQPALFVKNGGVHEAVNHRVQSTANGGGVVGADRKSARETPSPAPAITKGLFV